MSPEAVRLLDRLGVVPAARGGRRRAAPRHARSPPRAAAGCTAGSPGPAPTPFRPTGLSVARRMLDARAGRAPRAARAPTVLERTAVEELLYDGGAVAGAVVRDADGQRQRLRARLTVGADGLRSLVARRLGRRRHGRPRRVAFVAHVDGVAGHGRLGRDARRPARATSGSIRSAAGAPTWRWWCPADARRRGARPGGGVLPRGAASVSRACTSGSRAGALARQVLATGPFAAWSRPGDRRRRGPGGRRRRLLRPVHRRGDLQRAPRRRARWPRRAAPALGRPGTVTAARLAAYRRARRRAFAGKWAVERLIGYGMLFPALFDRAVGAAGPPGRHGATPSSA